MHLVCCLMTFSSLILHIFTKQLFVFRIALPCTHVVRIVTDDRIAFKLIAVNTYRLPYNEVLRAIYVCRSNRKFR